MSEPLLISSLLWHRCPSFPLHLLTLAHMQEGYCNRSVCVCVCVCVCMCLCLLLLFSRTVAAMETKHGYVGKYHRCSRLTETGVLFPRVKHIPSGKHFLWVCDH